MVRYLCSTCKDLGSALKIANAFRKTEAEVRCQITADFGYGEGEEPVGKEKDTHTQEKVPFTNAHWRGSAWPEDGDSDSV